MGKRFHIAQKNKSARRTLQRLPGVKRNPYTIFWLQLYYIAFCSWMQTKGKAMKLNEVRRLCFGGAVVCVVQERQRKAPEKEMRMVLLYLSDSQKMAVGPLRALTERDVVALRPATSAQDPKWRERVEINMTAPETLVNRLAMSVRQGVLDGESWIGKLRPKDDDLGAYDWEREDGCLK